jgi:hypothetical protein
MVAPAILIACSGEPAAVRAAELPYPALVHPGDDGHARLTLFPPDGPAFDVGLPAGVPAGPEGVTFGRDAKSIFFRAPRGETARGVLRIEFKPARLSVVPGTSEVVAVWHLTSLQPEGPLFISGLVDALGQRECGTFELDLGATRLRKLLAGSLHECGGGGGAVSDDGERLLSFSAGELRIVNLVSGASRVIRGLDRLGPDDVTWKGLVKWSPDGRVISAIHRGRIILIDVDNPLKRRDLGPAGGGEVVWSSDSKRLLLLTGSCGFGYFQSLQTLDVETGKRSKVKSARCAVSGGYFGWLDPIGVQ